HELQKQPVVVFGERKVMPMVAMVAEQVVTRGIEEADHADGVGFLPDTRMRSARKPSFRVQIENRLLEPANERHLLVAASKIQRGGRGHCLMSQMVGWSAIGEARISNFEPTCFRRNSSSATPSPGKTSVSASS